MTSITLLTAGTTAATLLLGPPTVALGQEEVAGEGPHYLFGEVAGYLHPNEDNPLGCDVGFTSENTLYGESTLLGATTVRQVNCYVPTDTLDTIKLITVTYTAESGDTLTATGSGDCIPDVVSEPGGFFSCWGTTTITGGTGAFEGATGEIHAMAYTFNTQSDHPEAAPGDVPISMLFEGLVEY
jgi:hypothetical protein